MRAASPVNARKTAATANAERNLALYCIAHPLGYLRAFFLKVFSVPSSSWIFYVVAPSWKGL